MFRLAWQLLGGLIVVVGAVVIISTGWNVLHWLLAPSEREDMPGFGRLLSRLALGIVVLIVAFWLLWHGR